MSDLYYGQPINWSNPLNRGLVSRWKVVPWYSSGLRLIDLAGVAGKMHGTLTSGPTWTPLASPNSDNRALKLDGVDDFVTMGSVSTFNLGTTGSATFGGWAARTGTAGGFLLCNRSATAASGIDILMNDASVGGSHNVRCGDGTNNIPGTDWVSGVGTGIWFHIMGVVNRADNTMKIFGNGVQRQSDSIATVTGSINSSAPMQFGARNGSGSPFAGYIKDLAFFNRALSASEIKEIYDATSRRDDPTLSWITRRVYSFSTAAATSVGPLIGPGRLMGGTLNSGRLVRAG